VVLQINDGGRPRADELADTDGLAGSGGGYGLRGMRERAQILGGSLSVGPDADGWRVELRLPATGAAQATQAVPAGNG
jgi:signal transduction histidine kinase